MLAILAQNTSVADYEILDEYSDPVRELDRGVRQLGQRSPRPPVRRHQVALRCAARRGRRRLPHRVAVVPDRVVHHDRRNPDPEPPDRRAQRTRHRLLWAARQRLLAADRRNDRHDLGGGVPLRPHRHPARHPVWTNGRRVERREPGTRRHAGRPSLRLPAPGDLLLRHRPGARCDGHDGLRTPADRAPHESRDPSGPRRRRRGRPCLRCSRASGPARRADPAGPPGDHDRPQPDPADGGLDGRYGGPHRRRRPRSDGVPGCPEPEHSAGRLGGPGPLHRGRGARPDLPARRNRRRHGGPVDPWLAGTQESRADPRGPARRRRRPDADRRTGRRGGPGDAGSGRVDRAPRCGPGPRRIGGGARVQRVALGRGRLADLVVSPR